MATSLQPSHMANFIANLKEVDRLSDIHAIVTPKGPGRKHNVQILHGKAALLFQLPCAAVRCGRQARRGIDRTSIPFRQGRSPVEKPGHGSRTWRA
jgi:hypothetical protein